MPGARPPFAALQAGVHTLSVGAARPGDFDLAAAAAARLPDADALLAAPEARPPAPDHRAALWGARYRRLGVRRCSRPCLSNSVVW